MAQYNNPNQPEIVRLAMGLLRIAYQAMPGTFFVADSRCELARKVLRDHGIDYNPADDSE